MTPDRVFVAVTALLIAFGAAAQDVKITRYIDHTTDRIPVHTVVPEYPHVARRDRIEGEVQVCYHIDKKGRPYRVAVRNSSHRIFERPAIRAVKASSYKPLQPGETRSGIKTCRTFRFVLTPAVADNDN